MSASLIALLYDATLQTLYMVAVSALLGTICGLPLGVFLATSQRGELMSAPVWNKVLGLVVNGRGLSGSSALGPDPGGRRHRQSRRCEQTGTTATF